MIKRHVVPLTDDRRADLADRFAGRLTLRVRNRIQVLVRSDDGDTDEEVADALEVRTATVAAVRERFASEGLEAALTERPRSAGPAEFDGQVEATIVARACPPTPDGRAEWTAKLVAGRLVESHVAEGISARRRLRRTRPRSAGGRGEGSTPAG